MYNRKRYCEPSVVVVRVMQYIYPIFCGLSRYSRESPMLTGLALWALCVAISSDFLRRNIVPMKYSDIMISGWLQKCFRCVLCARAEALILFYDILWELKGNCAIKSADDFPFAFCYTILSSRKAGQKLRRKGQEKFMFSDLQKEYFKNAVHRWNIKTGATRSGKTYCDYFTIPQTKIPSFTNR